MDPELEPIYLRISQAKHPEDVFGYEDIVLPVETLLTYLGKEYDQLKVVVRPDAYKNPNDIDAAAEAQEALKRFYKEGQRRIRDMSYGILGFGAERPSSARHSFDVGDNRYYVGELLRASEHTKLYRGFLQRHGLSLGEVVLKVADGLAANSRIEREMRVISVLHTQKVPQWRHLPFVLDRFQAAGKKGLVFRKMHGFSLREVREHSEHYRGVDQRHVVWMLDRMLSALGYVHSMGVVYGGITPDHVMIQPKNHNLFFAGGWAGAAHNPALSKERVEDPSEVFSAPEVIARGEIGPWSDIYSLGKLAIWLLGGNPVTEEIPSSVEKPIQEFLRDLLVQGPESRPSDAWELYHIQCEIKDSLWPRKFLHFNMS